MPSTRKTPQEFLDQLRRLVAANAAGNTQLVGRLSRLLQNAAQSARTEAGGRPRDSVELLSGWLDFNLASYSLISTHGLALLNGLLSAAETTLIPRRPEAEARPAPGSRVDLRVSGRPGERVTSAFLVENHHDRPLEVTIEAGELVPGNGPSLPASFVTFAPGALTVASQAQAVVEAAVGITRDFVVGQTYTTVIRLLGSHAKEIGFSLTVLPPAPGMESSPSASTRPAKQRRARR